MSGPLIALAGIFGLAIGSFMNVVVYRVPRKISIVLPGSHCPSCKVPIPAWLNVPVLSWVLLKGRCRNCRVAISPRYPLIEAYCGALFTLTAYLWGRIGGISVGLLLVGLLPFLRFKSESARRLAICESPQPE